MACLAADREVGLRLPDALKRKDLEPLPVRGLDDVAASSGPCPARMSTRPGWQSR